MPNISCGFDFIYQQHLFPLKVIVSLKAKSDILLHSVAKDKYSRLIFVWKLLAATMGAKHGKILNYYRLATIIWVTSSIITVPWIIIAPQPKACASNYSNFLEMTINRNNLVIYGTQAYMEEMPILFDMPLFSVYFLMNSSNSIIRSKS